jgi:exosortase/archaeosortase family protein
MRRMPPSDDFPASQTDPDQCTHHWSGVSMVLGIAVLVGLLYLPLLYWLGRVTLHTGQLMNGAVLVCFAVAICTRDAIATLKPSPGVNDWGLGLLGLAVMCLWLAGRLSAWLLPLTVLSFCLSISGIVSFVFGKPGVQLFLPALGAFFVFGILVGLVPKLDWPLRTMAARYAGSLLATLGATVKVALVSGRPPELVLAVGKQSFVVATECNRFGLLTSALLVATILMFQYRLPWVQKLGLLALAVPIAIVCNFLRIVSICLVAPRTALPYGFVHESLGVCVYFLGLGLIWMIANRQAPSPSRK